jgi:CheY-like chemotaxis protein
MEAPLGIGRALLGIVGILAVACAVAHGNDPLTQAVVDAVAVPPPQTPRQLLDAAIKTNDVDAFDASLGYWKQLVQSIADAGEGRNELLADLGDRADPGALKRLERTLGPRDPDVLPVVQALFEAAALRRRDPKELARAIEDLRSESPQTRLAATDRLGRTGLEALPALVDLLQSTDPEGARARNIARGLVRSLGVDARRVLVAWLGSNDIDHWPGVITALDALEDDEAMEFFLAPALAEGLPPLARSRALTALEHYAQRCGQDDTAWQPPTRGVAIALLTQRLDRVLAPPPYSSHGGARHSIARHDVARYHEADNIAARDREAAHLARDLAALGVSEPHAVRLVLLAQLEATRARPKPPTTDELLASLEGPDGIDVEAIADVLDLAVARGMFPAAALAAEALSRAAWRDGKPPQDSHALPPVVRAALVRALGVPDFALQFAAARTLALAGSDPPYSGASRVIEVLRHAAASTGTDRVIVVHHEAVIAAELAADISRFGYRPVVASTGREAVALARESRDVVLVILGARINHPSAYETAQFIQQQPFGDIPPILVVIDPLDDDPRGRFLTRRIGAFAGLECVALVDRLDSFFEPVVDPQTQAVVSPPRFPEALAHLAGSQAVDTAARAARAAARREQAKQAAALLQVLACRGWEVPNPERYNQVLDASPPANDATPVAPTADAALPPPTR